MDQGRNPREESIMAASVMLAHLSPLPMQGFRDSTGSHGQQAFFGDCLTEIQLRLSHVKVRGPLGTPSYLGFSVTVQCHSDRVTESHGFCCLLLCTKLGASCYIDSVWNIRAGERLGVSPKHH